MGSVLVVVKNGEKVIDSGTGVVLHKDAESAVTYVLTCAHVLKALGERVADRTGMPVAVLADGRPAHDVGDAELTRYDLAVLVVSGLLEPAVDALQPAPLAKDTPVRCEGFVGFFRHEFERRKVDATVGDEVDVSMTDGTRLAYWELRAKGDGRTFRKGLSGAPVYDDDRLVGVARILDRSLDGQAPREAVAYAIQLTDALIARIREKVPLPPPPPPPAVPAPPPPKKPAGSGSKRKAAPPPPAPVPVTPPSTSPDAPPKPPPPLARSVEDDDIQKGRWGGASEGYGRKLRVENVRTYRRYFMFDAVLEADQGLTLEGPFVFHLHDTFQRSAIWIRRTNPARTRAVLEDIDASGTFTLGVQFKDALGVWRSLEYDLADYREVNLKAYDKRSTSRD